MLYFQSANFQKRHKMQRGKDVKKYRNKDVRKISRFAANEDTFYRLFLTSDPYMSALRLESFNQNHKILDLKAIE
jgi:hypothetical protein